MTTLDISRLAAPIELALECREWIDDHFGPEELASDERDDLAESLALFVVGQIECAEDGARAALEDHVGLDRVLGFDSIHGERTEPIPLKECIETLINGYQAQVAALERVLVQALQNAGPLRLAHYPSCPVAPGTKCTYDGRIVWQSDDENDCNCWVKEARALVVEPF